MALSVGSVTINPLTGATLTSTGATGAAFDVLEAKTNFGTLSVDNPVAYANAKTQLVAIAEAIATATSYLLANGELEGVVAAGIAVSTSGTATSQTGSTTATGEVTGKIV